MNEKCVFLEFYDRHDVWHMSFACAMFFIYLVSTFVHVYTTLYCKIVILLSHCTCYSQFILVLDDGVFDRETKKFKNF